MAALEATQNYADAQLDKLESQNEETQWYLDGTQFYPEGELCCDALGSSLTVKESEVPETQRDDDDEPSIAATAEAASAAAVAMAVMAAATEAPPVVPVAAPRRVRPPAPSFSILDAADFPEPASTQDYSLGFDTVAAQTASAACEQPATQHCPLQSNLAKTQEAHARCDVACSRAPVWDAMDEEDSFRCRAKRARSIEWLGGDAISATTCHGEESCLEATQMYGEAFCDLSVQARSAQGEAAVPRVTPPADGAARSEVPDAMVEEAQHYDDDPCKAAIPRVPPLVDGAARSEVVDAVLGETQPYGDDPCEAAIPRVPPRVDSAARSEIVDAILGETQHYADDPCEAAMPRLPPLVDKAARSEVADALLGETQLYGEDPCEAAMPKVLPPIDSAARCDVVDAELEETQHYGGDPDEVPMPMSLLVQPTKVGRRWQMSRTEEMPTIATETPPKLKIPAFVVPPVATPARSFSKPPGLQHRSQHSGAASCNPSPCAVRPDVSQQPAKRRRLTGKHRPPVPNPWSATTSQSTMGSHGLGDAAAACSTTPCGTSEATDGQALCRASCSVRRSPIVRTIRHPPCFTTTGMDLSKKNRRFLEVTLRARVVDVWSPHVTHLICDTFRRTTKMMCAICVGARIVTPAYVDACRAAGSLVDDTPYILRDRVCEATFARRNGLQAYSVEAALSRARVSGPLLAGFSVYCAPSVLGRQELQVLVESAGGKWLRRCPPSTQQHATAKFSNSQAAAAGGKKQGLQKLLLLGKDFDAELVREAACTQVLRCGAYRLSRPVNAAPAPT